MRAIITKINGEPGRLVAPIAEPPLRFVHSATELMTRERDHGEWERRYRHGVQSLQEFVIKPEGAGEPVLQATVRGTVIHGVLERIQQEDELAAILEETIGGLDDPELERFMSSHSRYRAALEAEIRRIVRSDTWKWYVEGENYRELSFLHLLGVSDWRVGAFDLYRPGDPETWVVDFKTHEIGANEVAAVAVGYRIQAQVYRMAAQVAGPARVRLHFTGPDKLVDDLFGAKTEKIIFHMKKCTINGQNSFLIMKIKLTSESQSLIGYKDGLEKTHF